MVINREFIENIEKYRCLGSGIEGTTYFDGQNAYKIYKLNGKEHLPFNRKLLTGFKSDFIAFPIEEYKLSKHFTIGYKMPYFDGYNVYREGFNKDTLISNIESAYLELEKELQKFDNIYMFDIESNILFNGNKFYLIDTDRWQLNNIKNFNSSSLSLGLKITLLKRIKYLRNVNFNDSDLNELLYCINSVKDRNIISILNLLKEYYVFKTGSDPITIGDLELGVNNYVRK